MDFGQQRAGYNLNLIWIFTFAVTSINRVKQDILLWSDGGGSIAVGVVDQSVEGLIHPLPEHHSRNCSKNRQIRK